MKFSMLTLALMLSFSLGSFAQTKVNPSGNIVTKTYDFKNISAVDIGADFMAYITFGNETKVTVEADDNMMQYLDVRMNGNELMVKQKGNLWVKGKETLILRVTTPSLTSISGDEDAIIELMNDLKANSLDINLNEDSSLTGNIGVMNLNVDLDEDSCLTLTGNVVNLKAKLNEDSELKSYALSAKNADLNLLEDSIAKLTVVDNLKVSLREDSMMSYKGSPNISRQIVMGDSELRNAN